MAYPGEEIDALFQAFERRPVSQVAIYVVEEQYNIVHRQVFGDAVRWVQFDVVARHQHRRRLRILPASQRFYRLARLACLAAPAQQHAALSPEGLV